MDSQIPTTITIHDIPSKVRISLPQKADTFGSSVISGIGFIIFVIGALFIIGGPDKIYYNVYEGMTFVQYLQAYPGPIAAVGGLIIGLGNHMSNTETKEFNQAFNEAIEAAIEIHDDEVPKGYKLNLDNTAEEDIFYASFVEDLKEDTDATLGLEDKNAA